MNWFCLTNCDLRAKLEFCHRRMVRETRIEGELCKQPEDLRACSGGGKGSQEGEVPHLRGVTNLSIYSLYFLITFTCEVGYITEGVTRSAEAGNPLSWGEFSPCECWRRGGVMFIWAIISEFFVYIRT